MNKKFSVLVAPLIVLIIFSLAGCVELDKLTKNINVSRLSQSDIAAGLKEALRVSSETVVQNLGRTNGFNNDKVAHIVLPENLNNIRDKLKLIGFSGKLDDLELRINRAAEKATPKAKKIFVSTIREMKWDDVKKVYNGPNDAATRYFQNKMTPQLKKELIPVINTALNQVGVVRRYNEIAGKYNSLPFVKPVRSNLSDYTLNKTLDAVFYYLALEEAAIRKDPAKRTTALLKRVFGYK